MLTDAAKEDWLNVPVRSSPIWNHFEKFLQEQSQACKERKRLSLIQSSHRTAKKECSRCKAPGHTQKTCTAQFCISCRSWKCKNRDHKKQQTYEEKKSYCKHCDEDHPYGKHTQRLDRQRNDLVTGQKSHMQSASKCSRCNREVRDTLVTCGACDQSAKAGEKLHCFDHCPLTLVPQDSGKADILGEVREEIKSRGDGKSKVATERT